MIELDTLLVEGFHDAALIGAICRRVLQVEDLRVQPIGGLPRAENQDARLNAILQAWLLTPNARSVGLVVDADAAPSRIWHRLQRLPILANTEPRIGDESILSTGFVAECRFGSQDIKVGIWIMPDNMNAGQLEDFVLKMVPANYPVKLPAQEFIGGLPTSVIYPTDLKVPKHVAHAWLSAYYPGWSFDDALMNGKLADPTDNAVGAAFINWLRRLVN